MGKSQLRELKGLEKENSRLKKIVADLEQWSMGRGARTVGR